MTPSSSLREEARALAGQGMVPSAGRPARSLSVSPNSSRDGTESPVQSSSPGSGTYSDPRLYLPGAASSALSGSAVPPLLPDDPVLTAQLAMGIR